MAAVLWMSLQLKTSNICDVRVWRCDITFLQRNIFDGSSSLYRLFIKEILFDFCKSSHILKSIMKMNYPNLEQFSIYLNSFSYITE